MNDIKAFVDKLLINKNTESSMKLELFNMF